MITTNLTGNLGNHMWQYSVCRIIAEKLGYEWGINSSPTHDYFQGKSQMTFMDVDYGKPIEGIQNTFCERWPIIQHVDMVNITLLDKRLYEISDNTIIMGDNNAYGALLQSEDYLIDRKEDVQQWFKIKKDFQDNVESQLYEMDIKLDDNLCVINFRGGEYNGLVNVLLRKEYWKDAINNMLNVNPSMQFLVITDDTELSRQFMPFPIRTVHVGVEFDFYVVNNAKWLIISNSSFGWWAAWLNKHVNKIIAPKYWARHNVSGVDGKHYWATGDMYTRSFTYLDRDGIEWDYDSCRTQAETFYKTLGLI